MLIYYADGAGRPDVPAETPVDETTGNALEIFRSLDLSSGFLGIFLKEPFVLQMMPEKEGVHIELLDQSIPACDYCEGASSTFAEGLITAAGNGEDVFQIARQTVSHWEHLDMS